MSNDKVLQAANLRVGTKQTTKVVESGQAGIVFIAKDADPRLTAKVIKLCDKKGVRITWFDTMKKLGKACGIEVGAAMAVTINE